MSYLSLIKNSIEGGDDDDDGVDGVDGDDYDEDDYYEDDYYDAYFVKVIMDGVHYKNL